MMIKNIIKKIPVLNTFALNIYCKIKKIPRLSSSSTYWEERYKYGYNSGLGSYGELANFKADIINDFTNKNKIDSVIEFGCGDGNQLKYYKFKKYTGFDVSKTVVSMCKHQFSSDNSKQFYHLSEFDKQSADLAMSIDVIFHLLEDNVFQLHLKQLFSASNSWKFTDWVEKNIKNFSLIEHIPNKFPYKEGNGNTSLADFYIYKKDN